MSYDSHSSTFPWIVNWYLLKLINVFIDTINPCVCLIPIFNTNVVYIIQVFKIAELFVRIVVKKSNSNLDVELEDNLEDTQYIKILKFYLNQLNEENFDYVFYIAGVDIHFNDRLGKLKISDDGIRERDETVTENFFSKGVPLCGVLGGGYNKDFNKLVELHSILHQSCAKLI